MQSIERGQGPELSALEQPSKQSAEPTGPVQARLDLGRLGLVVSGRPARRGHVPATSRCDTTRRTRFDPPGVPSLPGVPGVAGVTTRCAACRQGQARHRYRGIVQADDADVLCYRCYRMEVARHRAALGALRLVAAAARSSSSRRLVSGGEGAESGGRGRRLASRSGEPHRAPVWVD